MIDVNVFWSFTKRSVKRKLKFGGMFFQAKLLSRLSHRVCRFPPSPVLLRKFTNNSPGRELFFFFLCSSIKTLFCCSINTSWVQLDWQTHPKASLLILRRFFLPCWRVFVSWSGNKVGKKTVEGSIISMTVLERSKLKRCVFQSNFFKITVAWNLIFGYEINIGNFHMKVFQIELK